MMNLSSVPRDNPVWRVITRAVTRVKPAVFDIQRETDARPRMVVWSFFFVMLLSGLLHPDGRRQFTEYALVAISEDVYLDYKADRYIERFDVDEFPYEEIRDIHRDYVPRLKSELRYVAGISAAFLILPFFWPGSRPVRFDGRYGLVYTWHFGKLYIAYVGPHFENIFHQPTPKYIDRNDNGSLSAWQVFLEPAEGGKARSFDLGTFPTARFSQWTALQNAARDLFEHRGEEPDWLANMPPKGFHWTDPLRAVAHATFFPRKLDTEMLEPMVKDWMDRQRPSGYTAQ